MRKKLKISQIVITLAPAIITSVASVFISGVQLKNIESIKKSGDFATPIMIMEAKAECNEKAEKDLHRHEDWEAKQFDTLGKQINEIHMVLIERK